MLRGMFDDRIQLSRLASCSMTRVLLIPDSGTITRGQIVTPLQVDAMRLLLRRDEIVVNAMRLLLCGEIVVNAMRLLLTR